MNNVLSLSIGVSSKASLETYSHLQADFNAQSFWPPKFVTGAGRCFDMSWYVDVCRDAGQQWPAKDWHKWLLPLTHVFGAPLIRTTACGKLQQKLNKISRDWEI